MISIADDWFRDRVTFIIAPTTYSLCCYGYYSDLVFCCNLSLLLCVHTQQSIHTTAEWVQTQSNMCVCIKCGNFIMQESSCFWLLQRCCTLWTQYRTQYRTQNTEHSRTEYNTVSSILFFLWIRRSILCFCSQMYMKNKKINTLLLCCKQTYFMLSMLEIPISHGCIERGGATLNQLWISLNSSRSHIT